MYAYVKSLYSKALYCVPPCILAIVATLVYYPSLHYAFQFDDIANIQKHFAIRTHSFSEQFFNGPRWISYWLNSVYYSIDKFNPFYYRVGNVATHVINGLLIYLIVLIGLSGLRKSGFFKSYAFPIAIITSLLFFLHPIQTQTVSYVIQGQLEGIATLSLLLLSFIFLLFGRARKICVRVLLLVIFFVAAFFSTGTKEIAIVSPILVVLIDWFFVAQGSWRCFKNRIILHVLNFGLVWGCYLYFLKPTFFYELFGMKMTAKNNLGNIITSRPAQVITPWVYCISQFKVIWHYFWVFVWPYGMSVEYDWKLCSSFFAPDCFAPFLMLSALMFGLWQLWKNNKQNLVVFAFLWFFVVVLPRSSIIPSAELMYDYKTYGASLGLFFLMASFFVWFGVKAFSYVNDRLKKNNQHKNARLVYMFSLVALASVLSFSSYNRNQVWSNGLNFWGDVLAKAPGKARAYNNYGVELSEKRQRYGESIYYFKKAISMDQLYPDPCNNVAVAYANLNQIDKAIDAIKQGLKINPYYPEAYNNLSSFFIMKKDYDSAIKAAQNAVALRPWYGKALVNLGRAHGEKGNNDEAIKCFKQACTKGDLDNELGFSFYAKVAMQLKYYDDALFAYKKVKELNPANKEVDFSIANIYCLTDRCQEAIDTYKYLLSKGNDDFRIYYNMGEAYLKMDNVRDALDYFSKIRQFRYVLPYIELRLALCHERVGNSKIAHGILNNVIRDGKMPAQVRKLAHQELEKVSSIA